MSTAEVERLIAKAYQKAKSPISGKPSPLPPPRILHARNPVEAIQQWALLSSVIGSDAARAQYDRLGRTRPYSRWHRDMGDDGAWFAAVREAGVTLTPQRAVEVRTALSPQLAGTGQPRELSCSGIGDRVARSWFMQVKGAFGFLPGKKVAITIPSPVTHRDRSGVLHSDKG